MRLGEMVNNAVGRTRSYLGELLQSLLIELGVGRFQRA